MDIIERKVELNKVPGCGGLLCPGEDPTRYVVFYKIDDGQVYEVITCLGFRCRTVKEVNDPEYLLEVLT